MSPITQALLWFGAIVALIPCVLWLLKRTPLAAGTASGLMRQVAVLPLSPSQRLVTVEVGRGENRCWLVLGVTPQAIQTLYSLPPQDEAPAAAPAPSPNAAFAQLLRRMKSGDAD